MGWASKVVTLGILAVFLETLMYVKSMKHENSLIAAIKNIFSYLNFWSFVAVLVIMVVGV